MDVEEIEKVLPVQEDPDLATKLKNNKALKKIEEKKDDALSNAGTNKSDNMNKLQRRNTISDHALKRKSTKLMGVSTKSQKSDKRDTGSRRKINLDLHDAQIDEEDNDADDEGGGKGLNNRDKNSQKDEE